MMHMFTIKCIISLLYINVCVQAWSQWNYSFATTGSYELWKEQWSRAESPDKNLAPRPRRGHSFVLAGDYLVMFGGRGNEGEQVHIPRTYNVEKVQH